MLKTRDWIVLGIELGGIILLVIAVIVSTIRFKQSQRNKEKKQ